MGTITSTRNPRIQAAVRLHRRRHRRATGATLIEGPHVFVEALAAGVSVRDVFYLAADRATATIAAEHGLDAIAVSDAVLEKIAGTQHPRGPVAVIDIPVAALSGRDAIVLVGVKEPGNAGTIVRTAAAFGFDVLTTPDTVDAWSPRVLRAAAGGHFVTCVVEGDDGWARDLERSGLRAVALVVAGGAEPAALGGQPVALLVGEEAAGLAGAVVAATHNLVSLPMPGGTESLNAAVAAAIAMYERSRTR